MRRSKRRRLAKAKRAVVRIESARQDVLLALSDHVHFPRMRYDPRQWRRHVRKLNKFGPF